MTHVVILRALLLLPAVNSKAALENYKPALGFAGLQVAAFVDGRLSVTDMLLSLAWMWLTVYQLRSACLTAAVTITSLLALTWLPEDLVAERVVMILAAVSFHQLAHYVDQYDTYTQQHKAMRKKIRQLKSDLSNVRVESEFEGFLRQPIEGSAAGQIIDKLRAMQTKPVCEFISRRPRRMSTNQQLLNIMGVIPGAQPEPLETAGISFDAEEELTPTCDQLHKRTFSEATTEPALPSNEYEIMITSDHEWGAEETEEPETFGGRSQDRKLSAISRYSIGTFDNDDEDTKVDTLTHDEIEQIISAILSKEYLLSLEEQAREEHLPVSVKARQLYCQTRVTQPADNESSHFSDIWEIHESSRVVPRLLPVDEENSDIIEILEMIGDWDFNTVAFNQVTQRQPLKEMGTYVFNVLGLINHFRINDQNLTNFLTAVESGYCRDVYYHNSIHAADVLNSVVYLLQNGLYQAGRLTDIDVLALVISSLTHDIGHKGINNAFLVATRDPLATLYNDQSVLENMHCAETFALLDNEATSITTGMTREYKTVLRKLIISLILATDLAKHFEVLRKLRRLVRDKDAGGASLLEEDSRCVVLQCCLKVADIGHNAKPIRLHKQWTGMLHKEFFCQGDLERKLGFSVTPLFNRDAIDIAEAQRGFLTIVAIPLFETWEQFMDSDDTENDPLQPSRRLLTQQARKNVQFWEEELGHPTFYLDEAPPFSLLPDTSSNDNL